MSAAGAASPRESLAWLSVPPGCRWLDVGCGSGALTQTILQVAEPSPATYSADVAAISRLVEGEARRTHLVGVGLVYPFHGDARSLRLKGNEGGALMESSAS